MVAMLQAIYSVVKKKINKKRGTCILNQYLLACI